MNTNVVSVPVFDAAIATALPHWYAIQTRSRHEKKAAEELRARGIDVFLPLVTKTRRWSDRTRKIDFPLFSGYAFVNIVPDPKVRVRVLSSCGVVRFVGPTSIGIPIPESEIDSLRIALEKDIALRPLPFIKLGQKVRIRSGALTGMEGILTGARGDRQLIVSITTIQKSVSLAIEGYDLEPV